MSDTRSTPPNRPASPWQRLEFLVGIISSLSSVVAAFNQFAVAAITGAVAAGVSGLWLWQQVSPAGADDRGERAHRAAIAIALVVVALGGGVLGFTANRLWSGPFVEDSSGQPKPTSSQDRSSLVAGPTSAPAATSSARMTLSDPSVSTSPRVRATSGPATLSATTGTVTTDTTVTILAPMPGDSFAEGQAASGDIRSMPDGASVWLVTRPTSSSVLTFHGPCAQDTVTWVCDAVRLGPAGHYEMTAIVAPAAAELHDGATRTSLPSGAAVSPKILINHGKSP